MNSSLMGEAAKGLSKKILDSGTADDLALVRGIYGSILGRPPSGDEENRWITALSTLEDRYSKAGEKEARRRAWGSFARVLLSSNEFIYVE